MEIEEGVIRRGRRPRQITPSEISVILRFTTALFVNTVAIVDSSVDSSSPLSFSSAMIRSLHLPGSLYPASQGPENCSRNQKNVSTKTKVETIVDCISFQISFTIVYRRPSKIVRANKN